MRKLAIINGPNLNLLGKREPQIYGNKSLMNIEEQLKELAQTLKVEVEFYQSNYEGDIVEFIQNKAAQLDGIIINPAAFTKTGYSILEALTAVRVPFIEVHLSNIFARGGWREESIFLHSAVGHIIGFQSQVYELGVRALLDVVERE